MAPLARPSALSLAAVVAALLAAAAAVVASPAADCQQCSLDGAAAPVVAGGVVFQSPCLATCQGLLAAPAAANTPGDSAAAAAAAAAAGGTAAAAAFGAAADASPFAPAEGLAVGLRDMTRYERLGLVFTGVSRTAAFDPVAGAVDASLAPDDDATDAVLRADFPTGGGPPLLYESVPADDVTARDVTTGPAAKCSRPPRGPLDSAAYDAAAAPAAAAALSAAAAAPGECPIDQHHWEMARNITNELAPVGLMWGAREDGSGAPPCAATLVGGSTAATYAGCAYDPAVRAFLNHTYFAPFAYCPGGPNGCRGGFGLVKPFGEFLAKAITVPRAWARPRDGGRGGVKNAVALLHLEGAPGAAAGRAGFEANCRDRKNSACGEPVNLRLKTAGYPMLSTCPGAPGPLCRSRGQCHIRDANGADGQIKLQSTIAPKGGSCLTLCPPGGALGDPVYKIRRGGASIIGFLARAGTPDGCTPALYTEVTPAMCAFMSQHIDT